MAFIAFQDNLFVIAKADFADRALYKLCGFRWSQQRRAWVTDNLDVALSVPNTSWTKSASEFAAQLLQRAEESYEMSWKEDTDYYPPVPDRINPKTGLPYELFSFQRAGVEYALPRANVLIGDQPGLGKSPQAVVIQNATGARTHLIICPASLKENWRREVLAWTTIPGLTVGIAEASYIEKAPDGVYKTGARKGEVKFRNVTHRDVWPDTDVVIINYDILDRFAELIHERHWDQLTCDECHALKTDSARRTLFVLGGKDKEKRWVKAIEARKRVFLSGTPMLNRPIELWPLIKAFDGNRLGKTKRDYEIRYCGGHNTQFGFDSRGATHLEELGTYLREAFMVRRMKAEVLPFLPPKRRLIVALDSPEIRELVAREDEIAQMLRLYEKHVAEEAAETAGGGGDNEAEALAFSEGIQGAMISHRATSMGFDRAYESEDGTPNARLLRMDYACAISGLEPPAVAILFEEMAKIRHDLGVAKLSAALPWVSDFLDGGEKLLCFAYHADVVEGLRDSLTKYQPAVIYGKTPQRKRQAEVDRFQDDEACRVFDGNMHAAGVGFTLTRGHDVAFVEQDWTPTLMEQSMDRACRIGQLADLVTGYFLVANGSLDSRITQSAKLKEDHIQLCMDTVDEDKMAQGLHRLAA